MAYLDGTETLAEEKDRPKRCPMCGEDLITRWVSHVRHTRRATPPYKGVAYPLFVCVACQLSVQTATLPGKVLHKTRKAASAAGDRQVAATFKRIADEQAVARRSRPR